MKTIVQSCLVLLIFTVITGVLYPLGVWGVGQLIWPKQANGNTALVGQNFESDRYFFSRPSASNFGTMPAGASNLGPTNATLQETIAQRRAALAQKHQVSLGEVPVDLITASASGLDPHISVASAHFQVKRVARARGLSDAQEATLAQLVEKYSEGPQWGLFGESRVNVAMLNRAVDETYRN